MPSPERDRERPRASIREPASTDRQLEIREDVQASDAEADGVAGTWTGIRMDGPRYSRVHLDRVREEILAFADGRMIVAHSVGVDRVDVTLRADQDALAAALLERFGDAIGIRLGRHEYPLERARTLPTVPAPTSAIDLPDLVATVLPEQDVVPTGQAIRGLVHLRNDGAVLLTVQTGHAARGVLLDDDDRVVGTFNRPYRAMSAPQSIEPGGDLRVPFVAGSETSDPSLGATLPPGLYRLVVTVRITDGDPRERDYRAFVTRPIPLALEPAR